MRISALLITFTICFSIHAQNHSTLASNYLNNLIWSQMFDKLKAKDHIIEESPWIVDSSMYNPNYNNPIIRNILTSDESLKQTKIKKADILSTVKNPFFKYIPNDSILTIKALNNNKLLYTIDLQQTPTKHLINFKRPNNKEGEDLEFDNRGNLISQKIYDPAKKQQTTITNNSDTLIISKTTETNNLKVYYTGWRYKNGNISEEIVYSESINQNSPILISKKSFQYNNNGMLTSKILKNDLGNTINSVECFYANDTLNIIKHKEQGDELLIFLKYKDNQLSFKSLHTNVNVVETNYNYNKGLIHQITLKNKESADRQQHEKYEFAYDINGDLTSIHHYKNNILEKQYQFLYNDVKNIKSIRLHKSNGRIKNELRFEYSYKL